DPVGTAGSYRVLRGGSWLASARLVRAASRLMLEPGLRDSYLGFRLVGGLALRSGARGGHDKSSPPGSGGFSGSAERSLEQSPVDGQRLILERSGQRIELVPWAPERWCAAAGRDAHGLWATFEVGGVEHRLRWIPPGRYERGSPESEAGR